MNYRRLGIILSLVSVLVCPQSFAGSTDERFSKLTADVGSLVPTGLQNSFLTKIAAANAAESRQQPCTALNILNALRNEISAKTASGAPNKAKPLSPASAAVLDTDILGIVAALLGSPHAAKCGGAGVMPATGSAPVVDVLTNTTRELRVRVTFPQPHFTTRFGNGEPFTDIAIDGVGEGSGVGEPNVPRMTKFVAIPRGADVSVELVGSAGYDLPNVRLWPVQEEPVDGVLPPDAPDPSLFADKPFQINNKLYSVNAFLPVSPTGARALGMIRDLHVGGVEMDGAQYNPAARRLRVFTSLDLKITFGGDNTDVFADDRAYSVYNLAFQRLYEGAFLNESIVSRHLAALEVDFCGKEVLIITSPALRAAADQLAVARRAEGYSVGVRETGSGTSQIGTTNTEIQAYIREQVVNPSCQIRPTYIILFGNTANVPTFLVPCGPGGDVNACNIASDLPYALISAGDLFGDVAYGRIPVTDLADATAVVNKIITYQTALPAPAGDDFYSHATTTAYFQPALHCVLNPGETGTPNCDGNIPPVTGHLEIDYANHTDTRGFTITSEAVGNAMRMLGYNVDRLYTTDDANVIPEFYYNGTALPSYLRRPDFDWDANTTDFLNTYNAGRFLILHRDHGWPDGWAEPTLHSGHIPFLTNGTKLPVVFGINCSSAAYDDPNHPSFVELQVRRIGGGAIAGFGDTRVSPSFPNNHMTFGFFDSLFPNLVPTFGSKTPVVHLGEVLLKGKEYMATQDGIDWQSAGDTYQEHYLYGLLGDPTMQMWIAPPRTFNPKVFRFLLEFIVNPRPGDPPYIVKLPPLPEPQPFEGTMVSLLQGGELIGRGVIQNGQVVVSPETSFGEGTLSISLEQTGFFAGQGIIEFPQDIR